MVDRASDASSPPARTAAQAERAARRRREPDPSWHWTLARALGRATRATVGELDELTRTFLKVVDAARPLQRPSAASIRRERQLRAALLQKLGSLVTSHSEGGFASLEREPAFWSLVRQLQALRPSQRARSRVPDQPRAAVAVITAHTEDAERPASAERSDPGEPSEADG
jgi:hypothetical protein